MTAMSGVKYMKKNPDCLWGTYAATFPNSLLMTYLAVAVVFLTCVCVRKCCAKCSNTEVQPNVWQPLATINKQHCRRCSLASSLPHPTLSSSERRLARVVLFPLITIWYLSCRLSKVNAGGQDSKCQRKIFKILTRLFFPTNCRPRIGVTLFDINLYKVSSLRSIWEKVKSTAGSNVNVGVFWMLLSQTSMITYCFT